jgi:hypothetical protein
MAIFARAFSGLVNGNVGILRTMVAEMVPQKKAYKLQKYRSSWKFSDNALQLQPRAFSVMPLVVSDRRF